jgi:hypothetical protein
MLKRAAIALLACIAIPGASAGQAQVKGRTSHKSQASPTTSESLAAARANLLKATTEYKESLEKLTGIYEANLKEDQDRLDRLKELFSQGILSKRELDAAERKVAETQASLDSSRRQIAQADDMIAESETIGTDETLAGSGGRLIQTPAYMRFNGTAHWTLQDSATVGGFFLSKFGHSLPISAYGQTSVHDRLGFDHRNAIDVALNPDSPEGQALMTYLRGVGIPFIAFRRAVPGSATGAHIHIGYPSHRLSASDSSH